MSTTPYAPFFLLPCRSVSSGQLSKKLKDVSCMLRAAPFVLPLCSYAATEDLCTSLRIETSSNSSLAPFHTCARKVGSRITRCRRASVRVVLSLSVVFDSHHKFSRRAVNPNTSHLQLGRDLQSMKLNLEIKTRVMIVKYKRLINFHTLSRFPKVEA